MKGKVRSVYPPGRHAGEEDAKLRSFLTAGPDGG